MIDILTSCTAPKARPWGKNLGPSPCPSRASSDAHESVARWPEGVDVPALESADASALGLRSPFGELKRIKETQKC